MVKEAGRQTQGLLPTLKVDHRHAVWRDYHIISWPLEQLVQVSSVVHLG